MHEGKCKLCLRQKELQKSHLMPAGLYKLCRTKNLEPVMITSEVMMPTSRQLRDYLLCRECEQVLNTRGEAWLLPKLATWEGEFLFHDLLKSEIPVLEDEGATAYAAGENPRIDVHRLIHFAMGIFWKAAVHSWKANEDEPRLMLGPYTEPLRRFVLGEAVFPTNMALVLSVLPPPAKAITIIQPYTGSGRGDFRVFAFYVPGMEFVLTVGNHITQEIKRTALSTPPEHPIIAIDFSSRLLNAYRHHAGTARKSRRLIELLARGRYRPRST